jgi:hypothetical protein
MFSRLMDMRYLCIKLSLSRTDLLLQLKINNGLANIDVIGKSLMLYCYVCILTYNLI